MSDAELLALVLGGGCAAGAGLALAHGLLRRFGGLAALCATPVEQLLAEAGVGPARAAVIRALPALLARVTQASIASRSLLSDAAACRRFLRARLGSESSEVFGALFLDSRHRLIAFEELARGSVDRAVVYPRTVLRRALFHNAAAVVFGHNHPSGCVEPSASDLQLTDRLKGLLGEIDVRVLDHIVVGPSESVSMAERGLL